MVRWIYSFVFFLAIPFVLLSLYLRGKDIPAYRKRWGEHFAVFNEPKQTGGIWFHAVSVGEVLAAVPIIKRLQKEYPHYPITVTTTTPTGSERVYASLGDSVFHVYSPYDLPRVVKRFLKKIQPRLIVIMETELWPNLIYFGRKNQIPICVVNARMSNRSQQGYARLPIPTKQLLIDPVDHFACQHESDANRFIELGASNDKVSVTGSVKFDLQIPADIEVRSSEIFAPWLSSSFIWVAGSTHAGEDELILKVHKQLLDQIADARLIIVPRHPERFDSVRELIEQRGFSYGLRSQLDSLTESSQVFLCDSMGELMFCYHVAQVAFIGGSLVDRGGHNPLEAAALGKPVLTGKHVFNFADVYRNMLNAKAADTVSEQTLLTHLLALSGNKSLRQEMGQAGVQVVASNRGAISRTMKRLVPYLEDGSE